MLRRRFAVVFALLAATAFFAVGAQAATHLAPSVTLKTLTPKIDLGAQPKFSYSTSDVPATTVVVLQRHITGITWKDVATKPAGTNKTIYAPAPGMLGKYTYRMQARDSLGEGETIATTAHNHNVYVYGPVTMKALCPHLQNTNPNTTTRVCAKNGTDVGGSHLLTSMAIGSQVFPNYFAGAKLDHTSCRSAALTFTQVHNSTRKTWLKIHQSGDQVAVAGHSQVGHLNATLTGGQFFIDGSVESGSGSVFVGGSMSCWTATGTP